MNKFNRFIIKLDAVAETAAKIAKDLDANCTTAKQKCQLYRADRIGDPSRGAIDPDQYVPALEWKAKLAAAEQQKNAFWQNLPFETAQKIREIRAEFAAALDDAYSADPAKIDAATVTLLDSGICDAHEYARLLAGAVAKGNCTMARLIGAYAGRAADKAEKDPVTGVGAEEYRLVAMQASDFGKVADMYLGHFDVYADAIQKATENPAMLEGDALAEFSAGALQNFDDMSV